MATDSNQVYSATYSNVPVYEFNVGGNHVMRRRSDDWINATHILKVADFDKPARTRILEREVQKGTHEKVQGGYGKYQGTWIPLPDGRALAEKNGVLEKLRGIFDFVPGDSIPPPAPKHSTATSSKPRAPRNSNTLAAKRRLQAPLSNIAEEEIETPDDLTVASDLYRDDLVVDHSHFTNSKKRKRVQEESFADIQHQHWSEDLLNYFMLSEEPSDAQHLPPSPPEGIDLDRAIDEKGNTALHWASAMGDLTVVKELIARGASVVALSKHFETPLMRAVIFTNNFDKQTMDRLAGYFVEAVQAADAFGSTVFHHIATTTQSKSKYACARYYLDSILNKMSERYSPIEIENILNAQDQNGDTAMSIAARHGARKCVRSLIGRNAAVDIPNDQGQTADELIVQLNHRRRDGRHRQLSSSPFQMDAAAKANHAHPVLNATKGVSHVAGLSSPIVQTEQHVSEAATALTTHIFPLLKSKSAKLASAFDAEIADKDSEIAEAQNIIKSREEEIEALLRQSRGLEVVLGHESELGVDGQDVDSRLESELSALITECESILESEQANQLAHLTNTSDEDLAQILSRAGSALSSTLNGPLDPTETTDGQSSALDERATKATLLTRLAHLQSQRRELVRNVVSHQSRAGMGAPQDEYKRLISGALGINAADVEGMLPEILAELEDNASHAGVGLLGRDHNANGNINELNVYGLNGSHVAMNAQPDTASAALGLEQASFDIGLVAG